MLSTKDGSDDWVEVVYKQTNTIWVDNAVNVE